jgi:CRP-like cAMP-binding protein
VFDESSSAARLRERLTNSTEDRLGRALADLLENPLVTGAIGKAFDTRERAAQAQELLLGALNIPTAADIERLTRRLRSVSQRLEGIEDGVQRISRALADSPVERRLSAVEEQLKTLSGQLSGKKAPAQPRRRRPSSRPPA